MFFFCLRGLVSMDVSLRYVDINQCDAQDPSGLEEQTETGNEQTRFNTFMGTHRCKQSTEASHPKVQNINSHYWSLDAEIHRLEMIEIWIKWVKMMCKKEWCSVSKNNLKDPSGDEIPNGGKSHTISVEKPTFKVVWNISVSTKQKCHSPALKNRSFLNDIFYVPRT